MEHCELLLWWWWLSLCCSLGWPLEESWWLELWCLWYCLRPWAALPVPGLIAVSRTWSGMVTSVWSGLVMLCWGSQRRNLMWTIHYDVAVLITFKTPNVRAIPCYVAMFLALEKSIFIVWHDVDCRWWSDGGSQLLYSIKLFNLQILHHSWSVAPSHICRWLSCGHSSNPSWIFWL